MRRKPHAWVENLVIGAAALLALIIAFFLWERARAPSVPPPAVQEERSIQVLLPPKPAPRRLKGSGTTSEVTALPAFRISRRAPPPHKIVVPAPEKK